METKIYLLDANVYIDAFRRYYPFELVGSFWKALVDEAKTGRVVSIDRVKDELCKMDDELKDWACNTCSHAFVKTDRVDIIHSYLQVIRWSQRGHFTLPATTVFAAGADPWLVAYARVSGHVVVTLEASNPARKNRIMIPEACDAFGVPYTDPFKMLKELKVKLG